jgi:hypothetical protein
MKVISEIESVNLSNGDRTRRVVGDGESRIERSRGFVDERRLGPQRELVLGPHECDPTPEEIQKHATRILADARESKAMNPTRCKMRLVSISGGYYGTDKGRTVEFRAVTGDSEENKKFFQATPSGEFKVGLSEAAAKSLGLDQGKIGSEFYFDITPVE